MFGDVAAVQISTAGMKRREGLILEALREIVPIRAILDRTPMTYAKVEGFTPATGVIWGDDQLEELKFRERGLLFETPLGLGQKTGYYFDQRPLRERVERLARGRRVLDVFSFVGPLSLAAARGGAVSVRAIDENAVALEAGAHCSRLNGLEEKIAYVRSSAKQALSSDSVKERYDLVILDPPAMAPSHKASLRALEAYRKLAAAGARATTPGGIMIICACSAAVGMGPLTRALSLGARDAGVNATVLERLFQGPDHPVPAAFPEGLYLRCLIARIDGR